MATLSGNVRDLVGPSFKGRAYSYVKDGKLVISAKPKGRKGKVTPDQAFTMKLLTEMCRNMKLHAEPFMTYAREDAKGTPMLPRDALLAAFYANGPALIRPDGTVIRSMPRRIDMSELLDNLAFAPGSMLYRGEHLWIPISPGNNGDVLKYRSVDQAPQWGTHEGETGQGGYFMPNGTTVSASAHNAKGVWLVPWETVRVTKIFCHHSLPAAPNAWISIFRLNGSGVIQEGVATLMPLWPTNGAERYDYVDLGPGFTLLEGFRYCILLHRPTASPTYALPLWQGTLDYPNIPIRGEWGYARAAIAALNLGDTVQCVQGSPYHMGYRIA